MRLPDFVRDLACHIACQLRHLQCILDPFNNIRNQSNELDVELELGRGRSPPVDLHPTRQPGDHEVERQLDNHPARPVDGRHHVGPTGE